MALSRSLTSAQVEEALRRGRSDSTTVAQISIRVYYTAELKDELNGDIDGTVNH